MNGYQEELVPLIANILNIEKHDESEEEGSIVKMISRKETFLKKQLNAILEVRSSISFQGSFGIHVSI